MSRVFSYIFLFVLLSCVAGCGSIADQDLADLKSSNIIVKKEAIQRISIPPSMLIGISQRLFGDTGLVNAAAIMEDALRRGQEPREVQLAMIKALGKLSQRVDLSPDILLRKLNDNNQQVRATAVEALGRMKKKNTASAVLNMLHEDPNLYVAIWALGEIGSEDAVPYLNKLLSSDEKYVRFNAYKALLKIGKNEGEISSVNTESVTNSTTGILKLGRTALAYYQNAMRKILQLIMKVRGKA